MKLMPKITFLIVFLLFSNISKADLVVYETYKQFKTKQGAEFKGYTYDGTTSTVGNFKVKFKKKGEKKVHLNNESWGFTYNGHLFRLNPGNSYPLRVISSDEICYYESGPFHLKMIRDKTNTGTIFMSSGAIDFTFSQNLNSPMTTVEELTNGRKEDKRRSHLEPNSDYKELNDCLKSKASIDANSMSNARECMYLFLQVLQENK